MRKSTIIRVNSVCDIYDKIKQQYSVESFNSLSREFIYKEISKETGLRTKTIATYLNKYLTKEILSE